MTEVQPAKSILNTTKQFVYLSTCNKSGSFIRVN